MKMVFVSSSEYPSRQWKSFRKISESATRQLMVFFLDLAVIFADSAKSRVIKT